MIENVMYFENEVDEKDLEQINILLKQLSPKVPEITFADLEETMANGIIFTAEETVKGPYEKVWVPTGQIIGMVTLAFARKPTARYGLIEDVIVHNDFRRKHIGSTLTDMAIEKSIEMNLAYIDLTSDPRRVEANLMYEAKGFKKRDSNYYRFPLIWK